MSILAWLESLRVRAGVRANQAEASADASARAQEELQRAARTAFDAGLAAYASGDFATAIACFNRALEYRHDDADAHNNLGLSYLGAGRSEDAADAFVLAIHYRPQFAQAFYNKALVALEEGELKEVTACLERAIELNPAFVAAYNTLGYVLTHRTGDFEAGAAHIRKALDLSPADPDVLCNYSAVLAQEGRTAEALAVCEKLLATHPQMHEARLNRALANLKLGRFEEAWPDYEARKLSRGNYVPRTLPLPEWRGESLRGKRVLIYAEQGLGDQIMFASCVPDVLAQAAGCLIECSPQLAAIFRRSFPEAAIEPQAQADARLAGLAQAARIDYQTAAGSLPAQFRRRLSDFPAHAGYLRAEQARIDYWKHRLSALGPGLKVGISWSGGAPSTRGETRSTRLADWLPILRQTACQFVNLQYGRAGGEFHEISREQCEIRVHDLREAVDDYDDTAALVSALDLVISVQTALVHLAGALGKRTWVLLPAACEWRYGEQGETMPWYPSVRLIRQPRPGDWQAVIERIALDVAQLA
jgi:tetratricopeptide (TPR) repeat protein